MVSFKEIDDARKLLGLDDKATLSEIKKAYYRKSKRYHPDKCPESEKPECEEMMKEINKAYKLILNYCEKFNFSFKEEDVERVDMESDCMRKFYWDWFGEEKK